MTCQRGVCSNTACARPAPLNQSPYVEDILSAPEEGWDPWRAPALLLWLVLLLAGLAPEVVFFLLREAGAVVTQRALVNSPHWITVAFSAYAGFFCLGRCIEAGVPVSRAQDKALQLGVVSLVAFLPFDFRQVLAAYVSPLVPGLLVYPVVLGKVLAWLYLVVLVFSYYGLGNDRAFANVPSLFPSSRRAAGE